jgi:hypothetical protein
LDHTHEMPFQIAPVLNLPGKRLALMLIAVSLSASTAFSQQRPTADPPETRYQRWLPAPSNRGISFSELEEQLKRQGDRAASTASTNQPEQAPTEGEKPVVDPKEVNRLQEIIKQFSDQLPKDFQLPNMDGLSNEAISKALEDPEVREKAQRLVEQYARNNSEKPRSNTPKRGPSAREPKSPNKTDAIGPKSTDRPADTQNALSPKAAESAPENNTSSSSLAEPESSNDPFLQPQQSASPKATPSQQQQEMIQSMEEFLKQMGESESKRSASDASQTSNGTKSKPADRKDRGDATHLSGTSEEIKKQLEEKGFGPTLKQIIEQARKTSASAPSPQPPAPSTNEPKANDTQSARSGTKNDPQPSPVARDRKASSATPFSPQPTAPPLSESNKNGWGNWLSKILQELDTTASSQPTAESIAPPKTFPSLSFEIPRSSYGLLLALAFGSCMILAAILYSRRVQTTAWIAGQAAGNQTDLLKSPEKIQSRADVIRAFHQLAYRIAFPVEEWWTHRNIARQALRTTPSVRSPMGVAVEIYEQARYLPSEVELSRDQIECVRRALKECETEKK